MPAHAAKGQMITPLRVWSGLFGLLVLTIIVFVLLFQWNWLRGPLARYLSAELGRPVTITGDLKVHPWSWQPWASVSGVTIGNPPWAGRGPMANLPRFTAQIELKPLFFQNKLVLPLVEADHPDVKLLRDALGRENWRQNTGGKPAPLRLPPIRHLIVTGGALRYDDVKRRIHFTGTLSSSEQVMGAGGGVFRLDGRGTYRADPFTLTIRGGPLVNIDPNRPYDFNLRLTSQATRVAADGQFVHPFDFGRLRGRLHVSGPDLDELYALTGVSLPDTPPYNLAAGFGRDDERFAFRGLHGRVGDSDLAGAISVNDETGRPFVDANLVSQRLKLADLEAVIGGGPRHTAGHTVSPKEKIEAARLVAEHRLLPDARLDYPRLRATDARLTYRAVNVIEPKVPIRGLSLKLALDHGLLTIDPLAVRLSQGDLSGKVRLDGRRVPARSAIDLRLANARLENLVQRGSPSPPISGGLYARAALAGPGDSVRAAAGNSNGQLTVVIPSGQ
ncbi:MAG TPA: AsmA family protein, partial [Caulobacteraceae bacterium]